MAEFTINNSEWKKKLIELGDSLKKFGSISMIVVVIHLIIIIFGPFLSIIPMLLMAPTGDYSDIMMTMYTTFIVTGTIAAGINLWKFIRYIQLLIKIKQIGEIFLDKDLQNFYKRELANFLASILVLISLIITLMIFIIGPVSSSSISNLFTAVVFSFLLSLVSTILSIYSTISFEKWAERIKMTYYQIPFVLSMCKGVSNMKIGRILKICLSIIGIGFIGQILFCSGLITAGKNMTALIKVLNSDQIPHPMKAYKNPISQIQNQNNNLVSTIIQNPQNFCSFCGSNILNKESAYCAKCGKKIN